MNCHDSLRLFVSRGAYMFEPVFNDPSRLSENLVIDRESGFLRRNVPAPPTTAHEAIMTVFGIFGIMRVFSGKSILELVLMTIYQL